jgi:uncharacterized protein YqgC (DUF456 family)
LQHHIENDSRYRDIAAFVRAAVDEYIAERDKWEAEQAGQGEQVNMLAEQSNYI